ncbi:MAG: DNA/RNA nuclease SfsA [Candidatus Puniceispirillum sp.]|nr:DNA/RNA nuclease SfsA [Candidatus Pelagibacter sp.]MBA4283031.1 DNA/RNA nuclease SfsA [Candidatus Puniceispirillum sp.]
MIVQGRLLKRYNRFLADVELENGEIVTAHCPNSGKLLGVPQNAQVLLKDLGLSEKRKLQYRWDYFLDSDSFTWVGVNTHMANDTVGQLIDSKIIEPFHKVISSKREVKYGTNSRIDFLLKTADNDIYVEVKSVHMKRGSHACFPDCPTVRGAKHLKELAHLIENPFYQAYVIFLVQRHDCDFFSVAKDLDADFYQAFLRAKQTGVQFYALSMQNDDLGNCEFFKEIEVIYD